MAMHAETFNYLKPSDAHYESMQDVRDGALSFLEVLEEAVPDGPDKTVAIRKLRECVMWSNVAITRHTDGSPRT